MSTGSPLYGGRGSVNSGRAGGGIRYNGSGGRGGTAMHAAVLNYYAGGGGGGGSGSSGSASGRPIASYRSSVPRMAGFDGQTGFDFAVGKVRGYRWWAMNAPDLSRSWDEWTCQPLTGAQSRKWEPGVNHAACNYYPHHTPPVEVDEDGNACGCGYWGYWTVQSHNIGAEMPVLGVIEGTGRTLIGELGFRCAKARIVALYLPWDLKPAPSFGEWRRQTGYGARLTEGGRETFRAITGHGYGEPPPDWRTEEETALAEEYGAAWMAVIQDRLMTLYPDAEIFATKAAMLAKYPPVGVPDEAQAG